MDRVTIECSANYCHFKRNNNYYDICNNPKLQKEFEMFTGGRVKLSGCSCSSCDKSKECCKELKVEGV